MTCLGCDDEPNEKNNEEPGPTKPNERGCTDMLCCCFLLAYWIGMLAVFALALMLGNPYSVLYGKDYAGFRCGLDGEGVPTPATSKVYYPQLSADLARQSALVATPWKLHLYGLCVASCPKQGERVLDYGCARPELYPGASRATCTSGRGLWLTALDTEDVANRCMPRKTREGNSTLLCAIPNCVEARRACYTRDYADKKFWALDLADPGALEQCVTQVRVGKLLEYDAAGAGAAEAKLAQSLEGMNQLAMVVMQSKVSILACGVALPIVIGFLFIFLMRFVAGPLVYAAIVTLLLVMLGATVLCTFKAGLFGEQLTDLLAHHANSSTLLRDASSAARGAYADALATMGSISFSDTFSDTLTAAVPGAGEPNGEVYKVASLVLIGLDVAYVLFLCFFSAQIGVAIEIIEEGSTVIAVQPSSLLYPFVTVGALCVLFVYFLVGGVFIGTLNNDSLESALTNFTGELSAFDAAQADGAFNLTAMAGIDPSDASVVKQALGVYHLFGFIWAANFLLAGSTMVIAGSVSFWFFYRNNSDEYPTSPVLASLYMVVRYHLGTIAFGSLCLAFVQALRALLEYVNQKTAEAQEGNLLLRLAMSCVRCCMWCFEKCVKFVSGYAYIYVALNGDSFCSACKATFTLFLNYPAQVSINAFVQTLLRVLQCVALPMACAITCFYYAQEMDGSRNPVLPSAISLVLAYAVCRVFSGVYETTIDTIFVCAMRDKDQFGGRHTPEDLARVLDIDADARSDERPAHGSVPAEPRE
ncbi:hypothetical protein KFE25_005097 [Diacronema lutheri]|uniref:Choline transporter-like protein n=1 Tax=Diacronema lutheri TaxID=2081491 RepID=A0A8J5X7G0_DIALT|nr:hypothetical protein KFE25_005097 [Diacronema lutheri]